MIFQQCADNILTNIMYVAFNRRHQDFSQALELLPLHLLFKPGESGLHGIGRLHHLRQEEDILLETPPDLFQTRKETFVADLKRHQSFIQGIFNQPDNTIAITTDDRL